MSREDLCRHGDSGARAGGSTACPARLSYRGHRRHTERRAVTAAGQRNRLRGATDIWTYLWPDTLEIRTHFGPEAINRASSAPFAVSLNVAAAKKVGESEETRLQNLTNS